MSQLRKVDVLPEDKMVKEGAPLEIAPNVMAQAYRLANGRYFEQVTYGNGQVVWFELTSDEEEHE